VSATPQERRLRARELTARFGRAADAAGEIVERSYRIGGVHFRLRYAGRALLDLHGPALEHLRVAADGEPGHVVEIWDAASTDGAQPGVPAGSDRLPPDGFAIGRAPNWRAIYQPGRAS
jgi:hypothetical protein